MNMEFHLFEALARGYMSSAGGFLTPAEKESLAFAGKLITFEIGHSLSHRLFVRRYLFQGAPRGA